MFNRPALLLWMLALPLTIAAPACGDGTPHSSRGAAGNLRPHRRAAPVRATGGDGGTARAGGMAGAGGAARAGGTAGAGGTGAPTHWVGSWSAPPDRPGPLSAGIPDLAGTGGLTVRDVVHTTLGGPELRVRLSNVFGSRPVTFTDVRVALATGSALPTTVAGSSRRVRFGGAEQVTVAPGSEVASDPVTLAVRAGQNLAISIYAPVSTGTATIAGSNHTNYISGAGDATAATTAASFPVSTPVWYWIDGVDVASPDPDAGAVVALGDSITAGVGSLPDADANWPDDLARRLDAVPGDTLSVVDEGIGGNRVLNRSECCGLSAIDRFAPDVLTQTGARDVILLEGVNDLGFSQKHTAVSLPHTNVSAAQLIAGDERIILAAHAAGLRIFGATLLPFKGARYWTPAAEAKREALNRWILTSGAFDGVLDFSTVMADPTNPLRLNPVYDSGDHLHPNDAGYQAMADSIDLKLFEPGVKRR